MARTESRMTHHGQVCIPARIRQKLGLVPGSRVEWCEEGDDVIIRRAAKYSSRDIHDALFPVTPGPCTVDGMEEAISAHLREKHLRR